MPKSKRVYLDPEHPNMRIRAGYCRSLTVILGRMLVVDILVDPNDASACDDRFILHSDDGAYEKILTVADDKIPGDDRVTLEFGGLLPERTYTLIHDTGAEGLVLEVFAAKHYDELFPTDPQPIAQRPLRTAGVKPDDIDDTLPDHATVEQESLLNDESVSWFAEDNTLLPVTVR